jgi:hypothetical protein
MAGGLDGNVVLIQVRRQEQERGDAPHHMREFSRFFLRNVATMT